jgi:hypothetical protein
MSAPLTLEQLHEKYFGAQDAYSPGSVSKMCGVKHDGIVKETRTFTFDCKKYSNHTHILSPEAATHSEYRGEAYTNFKITPSNAIYDIKLKIGEQQIERPILYYLLNKDVEFYEMTGGRAIPALAHHINRIEFEANRECQVSISYDVVSHTNPDAATESMLYSEQFTGAEEMCIRPDGKDRFKLNYNHPITAIYAFLPETTVDARIILDSEDHNLVLAKKDNYYVFEFGDATSVNFSRVNNAELLVVQAGDEEFLTWRQGVKQHQSVWSKLDRTDSGFFSVHIVGVYRNVLRRMNGMSGLAFSK